MWICSKFGFFSLVRTETSKSWQVQAVARRDLQELLALTGLGVPIQSGKPGQPPWFIEVERSDLDRVFELLENSIAYTNFTDCLGSLPDQCERLTAYDGLWHALNAVGRSPGAAKTPGDVARNFGGHLARVLETLNGFKDKYGHWPTRLRLSQTARVALQEKHLTRPAFSAFAAKLELKVSDKEELIAEDAAGLSFDYSKEGWTSHKPPQEADHWLWEVKL